LRRYLAEFLSDPRVVEIPRLLWLAILHGIILRVRPKKSALKYAAIWTENGSISRVLFTYELGELAPGVPEPASWAMLIAGFGLTGAAMRRRRAVAA
jgi:protoheme ferro-lyase